MASSISRPATDRPKVGDILTVVPNHVCVVVNMQDRYVTVGAGDRRRTADPRARDAALMAEHPRLLMLDPGDNIAVATSDLAAGEIVILDGLVLTLERATATGHKVAVRAIAAGEKVVKYGAPIGSATEAMRLGSMSTPTI